MRTDDAEPPLFRQSVADAAETGPHLAVVGHDQFKVPLSRSPVTIGRAPANDVALPFDKQVSRLHAILEELAGVWLIRDIGSRNGTQVNRQRVTTQVKLTENDEILVGQTRMAFRTAQTDEQQNTTPPRRAQTITRRERDVLIALIAPIASAAAAVPPATTRQIAAALWLTERSINYNLDRLYRKLHIPHGEARRGRLANEAIHRGIVSFAEVKNAIESGWLRVIDLLPEPDPLRGCG